LPERRGEVVLRSAPPPGKAGETYPELFKKDILKQLGTDLALADAFDQRRAENAVIVDALTHWFAGSLAALVIETLGLALASLVVATSESEGQPAPQPKPKIPAPAPCPSSRRRS